MVGKRVEEVRQRQKEETKRMEEDPMVDEDGRHAGGHIESAVVGG